jgi:AcrR family transcriptional regulator
MPKTSHEFGRPNQRQRTRKDLLQAAARLLKQGRKPSLEEIAAEALVSRATVYRYFPSVESLYTEAALDVAAPDPEELFRGDSSSDPIARLERADAALHQMILENETALRMMLVNSLQRSMNGGETAIPARQNRRTPLIQAALKPASKQFKPGMLRMLTRALALVIGTESMVVFKDVLQLSDAEARQVKRWTIKALVDAARADRDQ